MEVTDLKESNFYIFFGKLQKQIIEFSAGLKNRNEGQMTRYFNFIFTLRDDQQPKT